MDIEKILKAGETERVEFKKIFGKETIVSLVAFANSRGGRVVVGIDDNGRIRGFPCGPETVQQCFNEIKVSMYPQLSPSIDVHEFQGKTLLVLEINEYPIKPVAYKNRYCKRVGNSSHALSLNEIVELQQQCLNLSFDAYPLEEDLSSLDHDTMVRFFERVNGIGRANLRDDPLGNLTKLKIIKNGKPTLAAMLLFGNLTIEDLERDDYIPAHRNRLLAEAFYLTGDIEKYGTGFIRVRRMLHECGEFTLSVGAMGDFFKVEVSAARTSSLEGTPEKTGEGTPTKTGEGTPTKTGEGTPTKTGEGTPTKTGEGTPTKTGREPQQRREREPQQRREREPQQRREREPQQRRGRDPQQRRRKEPRKRSPEKPRK